MGNATYKGRHANRGLCQDCKRKAAPNRKHCEIHLAARRDRRSKEVGTRIQEGRCRTCGAPLLDDNFLSCPNCAAGIWRTR